jgi:uncharacterized protein
VQQSLSLVTLGVADYTRAKTFYGALGWSVTWEAEETAFFQANGVVLVLWSREKLAADMGVDDESPGWSGIAIAHNVGSNDEVDEIVELARRNGAEITREPSPTFYGGYAGVFRDLDGHVWEVAHNPGFGLSAEGSVRLPVGADPRIEEALGNASVAAIVFDEERTFLTANAAYLDLVGYSGDEIRGMRAGANLLVDEEGRLAYLELIARHEHLHGNAPIRRKDDRTVMVDYFIVPTRVHERACFIALMWPAED